MSGVRHCTKGKPLGHEPVVVGGGLGSPYVSSLHGINPDCDRRVGCLAASLVPSCEKVEVKVWVFALVYPSIEIEPAHPVSMVSEQPVSSV